MKYVLFGKPYGSFEECLKNKKYHFNTLVDMLIFIENNSSTVNGVHVIRFDDLRMKFYGYSFKIKKDLYKITTDKFCGEDNIEMYGCPQVCGYFVCLDDPEISLTELCKRGLGGFV